MSYWVPMSAEEAGTGRNLGGPITQLACRLYCLNGQQWPRLRLAAFDVDGEVEVTAWIKCGDQFRSGWDLTPIPEELEREAEEVRREAGG